MAKSLDKNKIKQLIGLVERGKITVGSIKDVGYRNAVITRLGG